MITIPGIGDHDPGTGDHDQRNTHQAYHALLRLGYALDYKNTEEVAFALAYWAATFYAGPNCRIDDASVEPSACLDGIVEAASSLQIRETNSIDGRIRQVYDSNEMAAAWKPVRTPIADPLREMSAVILDTFSESHHFTLLHALTSCQALRLLLPYLTDPASSLCHYWHSVCAAYVTVYRSRFEVRGDSVGDSDIEWKDIFAEACTGDEDLEHTVKLTYSCYLEFKHYDEEKYLSVAFRELDGPSPFV